MIFYSGQVVKHKRKLSLYVIDELVVRNGKEYKVKSDETLAPISEDGETIYYGKYSKKNLNQLIDYEKKLDEISDYLKGLDTKKLKAI